VTEGLIKAEVLPPTSVALIVSYAFFGYKDI